MTHKSPSFEGNFQKHYLFLFILYTNTNFLKVSLERKTMLTNPIDTISKTHKLDGIFIAEVIDNNDPKKLSRVKVHIKGLTEQIPKEDLPFYPILQPVGIGGSAYSSFSSIPDINTQVIVTFPHRDIYHGIVIGILSNQRTRQDDRHSTSNSKCPTSGTLKGTPNETIESKHVKGKLGEDQTISDKRFTSPKDTCLNADFNEDYPTSYGWIDRLLNFFKINRTKQELTLHHSSGSFAKIDADGNLYVHITGNTKIVTDGDYTSLIKGSSDISIETNSYNHVKKDRETVTDGNTTVLTEKNHKEMVQGSGTYSYSKGDTIVSDKGITVSATSSLILKGQPIMEN
ncbi:hypothetical protein ThvES_00008090 [Thiovulum sp. ES]|nr:hypothetical protein ThvES_00008090 [Thiovulum sp. ES]